MKFLGTNEQDTNIRDMSDEEVLALSVKVPHVFSELVNRYEKPFLQKARSVVGYRDEVQDIVQDTFTKIYVNAAKFKVQEGAKFSSWGYKILMNTSFTYYQKFKKERGAIVSVEDNILENFAKFDESEKHILEEYVVTILSRMPRNLSRVLQLHFIEGRPQQEVADELDISVGAVKARVHRAKKEFIKEDVKTNPKLNYGNK